jgi:hypothetical protein
VVAMEEVRRGLVKYNAAGLTPEMEPEPIL